MLNDGAILEVKNLMYKYNNILESNPPISKTIGFLEIGRYLKKKLTEKK